VGAVSTAEKDEIKAELRQLAAEMRSSPRSQPADDEASRTHDDAMASMRAELESLRAEVARPRAPTRDKRRTSYAAMKHDLSMLKKRPGMDDEAVRQQAVESLRGDLKQYADDLNAGVVGGTKQDREEMRDELRSLFQEFAAAQQDLAPGVEEAKEPDEASRKLSALTRQLEALQSRECGNHVFNSTSMCAYATVSMLSPQFCFENSTRVIDSSKNQPNRLRFDRAGEV